MYESMYMYVYIGYINIYENLYMYVYIGNEARTLATMGVGN